MIGHSKSPAINSRRRWISYLPVYTSLSTRGCLSGRVAVDHHSRRCPSSGPKEPQYRIAV